MSVQDIKAILNQISLKIHVWLQQPEYVLWITIFFYFLTLVSPNQLTIFNFTTVLFSHLLPIPMICLLIRKKNKALKDGLVHYLPPSIKRLLLESSIFDILCNIWFSNRLGKYLHAIFLPFFVSTTREEAH